ncbi:hypothetical protein [Amycolatopsis sp. CA-128772]|uniref:hypothetical protein n=1 Tax=Amycolatopsis sp. CA-128772 TaxID=2073159 RepID=UPI001E3F518D|nr:hypothetical protein [Amycolatopsis sp. CA-128772]
MFAGLIPLMLGSGNGIGTPLDFVIVGVVLVLFTVGYSAMTPEVRNAGAFYSYVQRGLGIGAGLGAATLALVTYSLLVVAVSAYLGAAARTVIETFFGVPVPWWCLAAAGLTAIGYLGYRNVEVSARVLGALLIAEVGIVVLVDFAVVLRGGDHGLSTAPLTWDAFTGGGTGSASRTPPSSRRTTPKHSQPGSPTAICLGPPTTSCRFSSSRASSPACSPRTTSWAATCSPSAGRARSRFRSARSTPRTGRRTWRHC